MSSSIKLKNANGKTVSVTNSNANQTDKEIIYLNTVDELSNASGSINAVAIVSDLDRGGTFEWSATGTANGGTVFAGASGYWNRQYSGVVNILWFGADINAVDNYTAIQNALNAAAPKTNDTGSRGTEAQNVYIPNPVPDNITDLTKRYFNVNSQLVVPHGVCLIGNGDYKSGITFNAWSGSPSQSAIMFVTNSTNPQYGLSTVLTKDIVLQGNGVFDSIVNIARSDNSCSMIRTHIIGTSVFTDYNNLTNCCVKVVSGTNFKTDNVYYSGAKNNIISVANTSIYEIQPIADVVDSHITFSNTAGVGGYQSNGGIYEVYSSFTSGTPLQQGIVHHYGVGKPYHINMQGITIRGSLLKGVIFSESNYDLSYINISFTENYSNSVSYLVYVNWDIPNRHVSTKAYNINGKTTPIKGTFTPKYSDSNLVDIGGTQYTLGSYVLTGNVVTFKMQLYTNTANISSNSGNLIIKGLPFTSNMDVLTNVLLTPSTGSYLAFTASPVIGKIASSNTVLLYKSSTGSNPQSVIGDLNTSVANSNYIIITGSYTIDI